jgi:competence protein ComEA
MKKLLILCAFLLTGLFALNFNTASKTQLMSIKGIGPKKADAIISYRKTHKIDSIKDLENIKGFSSKTVIKIEKQLQQKNKKNGLTKKASKLKKGN